MVTLKVFVVTKCDSVWTETDIKALNVKCSFCNDIFYILLNTQTSVTTQQTTIIHLSDKYIILWPHIWHIQGPWLCLHCTHT